MIHKEYLHTIHCFSSGPRYGDYKCIHDRTHRVCAKLVEDSQSCEEVRWPRPGTSEAVSFWDITGQTRWTKNIKRILKSNKEK